jgi:hypothetical protein
MKGIVESRRKKAAPGEDAGANMKIPPFRRR